jgi:flagellar basal body-associated protein FliL
MAKLGRKSKLTIIFMVIVVLAAAAFVALRIHNSKKCQDIIGDGYAMGIDPAPVVIGNSCDQ